MSGSGERRADNLDNKSTLLSSSVNAHYTFFLASKKSSCSILIEVRKPGRPLLKRALKITFSLGRAYGGRPGQPITHQS